MTCCCTLAGTAACKTCPTYIREFSDPITHLNYFPQIQNTKQRVTEKYEDGKLVERIIEDI